MTLEQLVGSRMRRLVRRISPYLFSLSVGILPLACEDVSRPSGVSSRDASAGRPDAGVADAYVGDTSVFTDSGLPDAAPQEDGSAASSDVYLPSETDAGYDAGDTGEELPEPACLPEATQEFYTGPEGTRNIGECRAGIVTCLESGGQWGYVTTTPQVVPTAELCDLLDNDCDGAVDPGCECTINESRECGESNVGACRLGVQVCDLNGLWSDCLGYVDPAPELCDQVDNDCNEVIDDNYHIGEACQVGVGECQRDGTYVCAELIGSACNAVPGQPWVEVCNGLDDDCDGVRDNGVLHTFYGDRDGDGFGNPAEIIEGCAVPLGYVENNLDCNDYDSELHPRAAELCDGIDNNCNDLIDEGFDNLGQPCSAGFGECQRDGVYVCAENKLETICNAVRGDPLEEICGNDIDEDCNGIDQRCLTKIAFHSTRDGIGEIYVMNEDGSDQVNLTNHPSHEAYPNWSPDGTKIAFTNGGDEDIIVVDYPGGGNRTNLTDLPGRDLHPNWSPDGTKIAFSSTRFGQWNVCIMDNNGENVQLLANGMYPTWSPDGQWIAYQRGEALRITSTDFLNNDRELVESGIEPAWSSDGQYIAFRRNADIWMIRSNGADLRQLTDHQALDWHPSWSPDSRKLVFASERGGNRELHTLDIESGEILQLTDRPPGYDEDPAWSRH